MLLRWTMAAREGDSGEDRSSGDADENPKVGWDVPPEKAPHLRQWEPAIGCSAYRLADFGASGQRFAESGSPALGSTDTM